MIPAAFEYRSPESIEEALDLLAKYREDARVLTGGHSLIPALKLRLVRPAVVVDLRRIGGLAAIDASGAGGDGLLIGALATHHDVEASSLVRARCPLLAEVAASIGDAQVRNFGTLVGSICHADPAADWPAALLACDARVVIASPRGERSVPVGDFFQGMLETALEPDELVRAVDLPGPFFATAAYRKLRQSASGFAIAGVAAHLRLDGGGVAEIAVAVTGVCDRAFRASAVEEALRGQAPTPEAVDAAVRGLAGKREVLGDMHASIEYRSRMAEVFAKRAVLAAAAGA